MTQWRDGGGCLRGVLTDSSVPGFGSVVFLIISIMISINKCTFISMNPVWKKKSFLAYAPFPPVSRNETWS